MNHWSHIVQESVVIRRRRRRKRRCSESERRKNTQRMMCTWSIHNIELNKIFQSTFRFVKPNARLKIMSTNVFGSMMHDLAINCRIEQISSFKKNLHACIVPEVTAAWPWSRKPRRGVQHCLEQKKQRSTWKGLLQFDENCAVQTTNHRCKHPKLKTRVEYHHRSFYSFSDITHYDIQRLDRHKIEEEVHRALAWLPKWYIFQFLWIFLAEESKV